MSGSTISAIEEGHIGAEWYRNKDVTLNVDELPKKCIICGTSWPCEVIRFTREQDANRAKALRGNKS